MTEEAKVVSINGGELPDNVVRFDHPTTADIPVENILLGANEKNLTGCVVLGWDEGGSLYAASSYGELARILELLVVAQHEVARRYTDADE